VSPAWAGRTWRVGRPALVVIAAIVVCGLAGYPVLTARLEDRIDRDIARELDEFRALAAAGVDPVSGRPLRAATAERLVDIAVQRSPPEGTTRFAVVDGRVRPATPPAWVRDDPRLIGRVAGVTGVTHGELDSSAGPVRYGAVPVTVGGQVRAVYVVAVRTDVGRRQVIAAMTPFVYGGAGVLAAIALAGWLPRRRVVGGVAARLASPLGAVVVEGFLSRLAFGIVSFALPLYAHAMGLSLAVIGLLLSTSLAAAVALKPVTGWVVDRCGVRAAYVTAVVLRSVVLLLLALTAAPWHLFAVRALRGVAIALRDPAAATVLTGLGGRKAVAQRFAWYQTAKTVAGSGGRFAAGALLTLTLGSYGAVFAVAAVLSAVPLGLVLWRLRGPALATLRLPPHQTLEPTPGLRRIVLPYAGLGFLATGTAYLMANLLPVLAVDYIGLSPAAAGSLYAITAVVALSGPVWGWFADHVSHRLVLSVRGAGNVLSSVLWLAWPTYAGLVAGKVADDVGKAAFRPAWGAVMARVADADPRRRARIVSWLGASEDLGEVAGPVVAGLIWSVWGLPAVLVLRALLGVATEAYAVHLDRRRPSRGARGAEPQGRLNPAGSGRT